MQGQVQHDYFMWEMRNALRCKHVMYTLKYPEIVIIAVWEGKKYAIIKYCDLTKSKGTVGPWPYLNPSLFFVIVSETVKKKRLMSFKLQSFSGFYCSCFHWIIAPQDTILIHCVSVRVNSRQEERKWIRMIEMFS